MPDPAPRERGFWRRLRHLVFPWVSRPLVRLAAFAVPLLYVSYMRFVWATSQVEVRNAGELMGVARKYGGAVAVLWHEEVATVAFAYPRVGIEGHTLASVGDAGEVITRVLERCGYRVFRGGASSRRSRRRTAVLRDMVDHMRSHHAVVYGLTVDGSKGPAYRMKGGAIWIARESGVPLALMRTWYRRCLRLRTWDRTAIPLPFNHIIYYFRGPYFVPEDAGSREGFERFRLRLESDLIDLAAESYAELGQARPSALRKQEGPAARKAEDGAPRT